MFDPIFVVHWEGEIIGVFNEEVKAEQLISAVVDDFLKKGYKMNNFIHPWKEVFVLNEPEEVTIKRIKGW